MTAPPLAADVLSFEAESHTYWHGMAQVPSVSEVMRPLTEQYLRSIPEDALEWKRQLGTAVHKACELLDLDDLDEEALDPVIVPYLEGYKRFLVDYRPQWNAIESRVFHREDWYAGTLDRQGVIRGDDEAIVDIKTSTKVASYAGIQLWAYGAAVTTPASSLYALQLLKTGNYKLVPFTNLSRYRDTWQGLLSIHRWTKEHTK